MNWRFWKKGPVVWDYDGVLFYSPEIGEEVHKFAAMIRACPDGGYIRIPPELGDNWKAVVYAVRAQMARERATKEPTNA